MHVFNLVVNFVEQNQILFALAIVVIGIIGFIVWYYNIPAKIARRYKRLKLDKEDPHYWDFMKED